MPLTTSGVQIRIDAESTTSSDSDVVYITYSVDGRSPSTSRVVLPSSRLPAGTTIVGVDVAGTGSAALLGWAADILTIGANDADLDAVKVIGGASGYVGLYVAANRLLHLSGTTVDLDDATAVTATGNPTWDLGTGTVDVDILRFGAAPPATGALRWSNGTAVHGLDTAGTGTTNVLDWGATTQDRVTIGANDGDCEGVDIVGGASGTVNVKVGARAGVAVSASAVTLGNATDNHAITQSGTGAVTLLGTLCVGQYASPMTRGMSHTGMQHAAPGDAQRFQVVLGRVATDAGAVELTLTGGAPGSGTRLVVPAGATIGARVSATAVCTAGTDAGKSMRWEQLLTIANVAGTTALVGSTGNVNLDAAHAWEHAAYTPMTATGDAAALLAATLVPTADDTNDSLVLTFTGIAGVSANTWHVTALVDAVLTI